MTAKPETAAEVLAEMRHTNTLSAHNWASRLERALSAQGDAHPDDLAVDRFATAMKAKLAAARAKGRGGWDGPDCNADILSRMLRDHVEKGDPRDVANFCMFLHQRGEAILPAPARVTEDAASFITAAHAAFKRLAAYGGACVYGVNVEAMRAKAEALTAALEDGRHG